MGWHGALNSSQTLRRGLRPHQRKICWRPQKVGIVRTNDKPPKNPPYLSDQWHQPVSNILFNSDCLPEKKWNQPPTNIHLLLATKNTLSAFVRFIFGCPTAAGKEATTSLRDASRNYEISSESPRVSQTLPCETTKFINVLWLYSTMLLLYNHTMLYHIISNDIFLFQSFSRISDRKKTHTLW